MKITKKTLFAALFLALALPQTAVLAAEVTFGASGSSSTGTVAVSNLSNTSDTNSCLGITSDLRFGMTSPQVVVLQNFLRDQGFFDAQSTGFFGTITLGAVRSYQAHRGITTSGFVGESTRAQIKQDSCNGTQERTTKKEKRFSRRTNTAQIPAQGDGSGVVVRDLVSRNDITVRTVQIESDSVVGGVFNNF